MQSSPKNIALFQHASMGIVVADSKGIIQLINPFALQLFGYEADELLGERIELLMPKRFRHPHVEHRNQYIQDPKIRPMGVGLDLFAAKKDGTEFPVEISLGNYLNDGDRNVIAFIHDISIRKKAEQEIIKLNDELEETVKMRTSELTDALHQLEYSSGKLEAALSYQQALLDNAGAIIIATDAHGIINLFNPEASKNLGYSEHEIINKRPMILFHDKAEMKRKRDELEEKTGIAFRDDFLLLIEKSKRKIHDEERYTYVRKNGSTFPVALTLTTIADKSGLPTGFMVIAVDISERLKAEKDLWKALEKEKELGELKSNFVSTASHEFRTPLSTVLSSAYLIEKYTNTEDQPRREKHLQRIISSVNMLTDILNDLLSVGKIEEGKIQVRLSKFNIENYIATVIEEIKNTVRKKQEILYSHEGGQSVLMDPALLKHIIMNLVSNASKFSPDGTKIEIKTCLSDDNFRFSVKDHGMGISKDDQKHLMERFFRASNAANIQGTGLGLHIVKKYAELLQGTVTYKSELEKGTEFIITFDHATEKQENDFAD